jgi:sarcosine oxidase
MTNTNTFDVIVIGVGGMGSATCFELAHRGLQVLGIEQYPLVHDQGSSHGHTRIIRTAYYEHPAYVPLVKRAYEKWYDLEQMSGKHLLTSCPCLSIGLPDSELIQGVHQAAKEHQLQVESLTAQQLKQTYPSFQLPSNYVGILEEDSGYLFVEDCVQAYIQQTQATIHAEEQVISWEVDNNQASVQTSQNTYFSKKLVITAGPWASQLLGSWGSSLRVMRQSLLWFETSKPSAFRRDRFPIFIADVPEGKFYGLPMIDTKGIKLAEHYGAPELTSPSEIVRTFQPTDEIPVRRFLNRYLPQIDGKLAYSQTCIYTLSPDRHFIIDIHPEYPEVIFATGFSGHGFKFASVVGEILADLTEKGTTSWPIDMFRLKRIRSSFDPTQLTYSSL